MATTREDIREWLQEGQRAGATHVIIASDTFSYEDFPVNVLPGENVEQAVREHTGNMQMVREVYALHLDLESQLNEHRAMHYEAPPKVGTHGGIEAD